MKVPVVSTYKILKDKVFNFDIDESWVDWAIEMIEARFEADSLYQLAGITRPYNQFELQDLTNRVIKDLQLDYSNKEKVLKNYVYFLITVNIENPDRYLEVLKEFTDIYYELDMDIKFQNWAFLYWAKEDLIDCEYQYYWDGANRTNINDIIREQFELFKIKFEQENNGSVIH